MDRKCSGLCIICYSYWWLFCRMMQGWIFENSVDFWKPQQIKAVVNAVPKVNLCELGELSTIMDDCYRLFVDLNNKERTLLQKQGHLVWSYCLFQGRMIILELFAEVRPVYRQTKSYFGQPFIWCMLHNFGGTMELYGRFDSINKVGYQQCLTVD